MLKYCVFSRCLTVAACLQLGSLIASGQTVQLPTVGTFSLQTTVSVPDSGAAYLGGNRSAQQGSVSRGPIGRRAFGTSMTAAGASVHATVIDLDELDRMIRSQTGPKPAVPDLSSKLSKVSPYSLKPKGSPTRSADYDYLAALTHESNAAPERMTEDAKYYLALAASARQMAHWNAVELYYKLAWESLPEERRDNALKALAAVKNQSKAADSAELQKSKTRK